VHLVSYIFIGAEHTDTYKTEVFMMLGKILSFSFESMSP